MILQADTSVPAPSEEDRALYRELQRRVMDAQEERSHHEHQWKDNHNLVLGNHREVFNVDAKKAYYVSNRARLVVDSHTAIMTEEPPRNGYAPREIAEPADWLLRPEAGGKLAMLQQSGVDLSFLTPAQQTGEAFIDEQTAAMLLEATVPQVSEGVDAEGNATPLVEQVPVLIPEDFYIINAQMEADLLSQEVENQALTMAHWENRIHELVFGAQVIGHKDILVQWNAEKHHFEIQCLYPYNVWIDPWATDTTNAEYYIVREFLSIPRAVSEYPHLKSYIEQNATVATATSFTSATTGGKYERGGMRPGIERWTWWERNQQVDVDLEDALQQGLVVPAVSAQPVLDPETGEALSDPETGEGLLEDRPVTTDEGEQVYQLVDDDGPGELVMPGDENWPKQSGLRQIQFLKEFVVFKAKSPFSDIPAARAKCMEIDESPYGQGEPQRIADLIDLRNRLYTIYHRYLERFAMPDQVMPADVAAEAKDALERLHSEHASKRWKVSPELWMQYQGNVIQNLDPPQLGPVIAQMMADVDREIDKVSGMSEVMRGETKSDQSGELFRQALEAARGPIGLKARNVARAIKQLGHVIADLVIDFMPPEVWAERNRAYPPQVFARVQERLRISGINVIPTVPGAETRDEKIRKLTAVLQTVGPVPTLIKQYLQHAGVTDAEKVMQEWQQMQMAAAMQPAEDGQSGEQPPQ